VRPDGAGDPRHAEGQRRPGLLAHDEVLLLPLSLVAKKDAELAKESAAPAFASPEVVEE